MFNTLSKTLIRFAAVASMCAVSCSSQAAELQRNHVHNYVEEAMVGFLFHELGHAFMDIFDLPKIGPQEDVADQFAAYLMLNVTASDFGYDSMAAFSLYMHDDQKNFQDASGRINLLAVVDEHTMGARRAFNMLCFFYGAMPKKYTPHMDALKVPDKRRKFCTHDYQDAERGWTRLLQPHLRSRAEQAKMLEQFSKGRAVDLSVPGLRVTYVPEHGERLDGRSIYQNEHLRFHMINQVAAVLSAFYRFEYDVDIFVRRCNKVNASWNPGEKRIEMCLELFDYVADLYIKNHGKRAADWWTGSQTLNRGPQVKAHGVWRSDEGVVLRLKPGFFHVSHPGSDVPERLGEWGGTADGRIWLIETHRAGEACFNPGCTPLHSFAGSLRIAEDTPERNYINRGELTGYLSGDRLRVNGVAFQRFPGELVEPATSAEPESTFFEQAYKNIFGESP